MDELARKVTVKIEMEVTLVIEPGMDTDEVLEGLDYTFTTDTTEASVTGATIVDWDVIQDA